MTKQTDKKNRKNVGGQMEHPREQRTNKAVDDLFLMKLISEDQKSAASTLFRSCLQAKERTKDKTKPWYKGIEFQFANPLDMAIQFITKLPVEWEKWQDQQLIFEDKANEGARPSIDRLDSSKHYSIDNIQTDSIKGNYTDASNRRRKKTVLLEIENGQIGFKVYESQTALSNILSIPASKLRNMKKRPYKLNFEIANKEIDVSDKKYITMDYIEYPPRPQKEQDELDKQSYLYLIERIKLLECLPFNVLRVEHLEKLKENLVLFKKFGWDKL